MNVGFPYIDKQRGLPEGHVSEIVEPVGGRKDGGQMRKVGLTVVACIVWLSFLFPLPAGASPFSLDILSGPSWLSATDPSLVGNIGSSTTPGAWTTVGFNDSSWVPAVVVGNNTITPQTVVPGTSAQFMWSPQGMQGSPNGSTGAVDAFFRRDFNLPSTANLPLIGQAKIIADDRFDYYVNGQFVKAATLEFNMDPKDPSRTRPLPVLTDFTNKLKFGENVLAIRGRDGTPAPGSSDPGDPFKAEKRGNQFVFFEGAITSLSAGNGGSGTAGAPEPGTVLLLGSGFVGLVALRRKP